jgi:hypothetical protein
VAQNRLIAELRVSRFRESREVTYGEFALHVGSNVSSVIVSSGDWDAKCMKNPLSRVDEHMGEVGAGWRNWLSVVLGWKSAYSWEVGAGGRSNHGVEFGLCT